MKKFSSFDNRTSIFLVTIFSINFSIRLLTKWIEFINRFKSKNRRVNLILISIWVRKSRFQSFRKIISSFALTDGYEYESWKKFYEYTKAQESEKINWIFYSRRWTAARCFLIFSRQTCQERRWWSCKRKENHWRKTRTRKSLSNETKRNIVFSSLFVLVV